MEISKAHAALKRAIEQRLRLYEGTCDSERAIARERFISETADLMIAFREREASPTEEESGWLFL